MQMVLKSRIKKMKEKRLHSKGKLSSTWSKKLYLKGHSVLRKRNFLNLSFWS